MRTISISDITLKQREFELSFKEKLDIAGILDKMGVSVIETHGIEKKQTDKLLLKSIAAAVNNSVIAVPAGLTAEDVAATTASLEGANRFRLQVEIPASTVQMEYFSHKKPDAILNLAEELITECKKYTPDVELIARDATRAEQSFLSDMMDVAIKSGATQMTLCDEMGTSLPSEIYECLDRLAKTNGKTENIKLGLACGNTLAMADTCSVAALKYGIAEIKTVVCGDAAASLTNICRILNSKAETLQMETTVNMTVINRSAEHITDICTTFRKNTSPFDNGVKAEKTVTGTLTENDDLTTVANAAAQLGYDLSEEDKINVFEAFQRIARKKDGVTFRELDTIVAASAMEVPPTYRIESYVINSGNKITATAMMKLEKNGVIVSGLSAGDGPIDAAFLAIEQITGHHYELDDFQLRSVTEGREAMGEALVKLRDGGRLFSGRGTSTDIVGSAIRAYVNALNKIVYEEE